MLAFVTDLKKVTSDMQTHKNPNLKAGAAPIKASEASQPGRTSAAGAGPVDKPPVFSREGKKWLIVSSYYYYSFDFIRLCICVIFFVCFAGISER